MPRYRYVSMHTHDHISTAAYWAEKVTLVAAAWAHAAARGARTGDGRGPTAGVRHGRGASEPRRCGLGDRDGAGDRVGVHWGRRSRGRKGGPAAKATTPPLRLLLHRSRPIELTATAGHGGVRLCVVYSLYACTCVENVRMQLAGYPGSLQQGCVSGFWGYSVECPPL